MGERRSFRGRPRWRCLICPAFGFADTPEQRLRDFEAHYRVARHKDHPAPNGPGIPSAQETSK